MRQALLVWVDEGKVSEGQGYLDEVGALCREIGVEIADTLVQRRSSPDAARYLGRGKLQEAAACIEGHGLELCIAGAELAPVQLGALSEALGVEVMDRTEVILNIFAQRAHSLEGKLHVELAHLRYRLPRLRHGRELSRTGGGIGTRGPGEARLETDRRAIRSRMHKIASSLADLASKRDRQGLGRTLPLGVLVGYTNAGKTSLLRCMGQGVPEGENHLFATLDPLVRKVRLRGGTEVLLTDTVGLVQNLPKGLASVFQATFAALRDADFWLQVVDRSDPRWAERARDVARALEMAGVGQKPTVHVWTKIDKIGMASGVDDVGDIFVDTQSGDGVDSCLTAIEAVLARLFAPMDMHLPYGDKALSLIHRRGVMIEKEFGPKGMHLRFLFPKALVGQLEGLCHEKS